ncbi:MAG: hypothetical protein ACOYNO_09190 [Saprospiraceae bacterium]
MPKPASDKLFRLIKGLTPAEKRHISVLVKARPADHNKYLTLFHEMDVAHAPDDAAIRDKIYPNAAEGKKYPELKAYLYTFILKCLQVYDEKRSIDQRIRHRLHSVEVLYRRGLYDDCDELLLKTTKIARQYEDFSALIEVLNWEKKLAYTRMDVNFLHRQLQRIQHEEQLAVNMLENAAAYRQVFFQVYQIIKEDTRQNSHEQLTALRDHELFLSPDMALSHRAKIYYFRAQNLMHYAQKDYPAFHETGQQLLTLLESKPHFLKIDLSDYIATLSNLILACGLLGRYDAVNQHLHKLQQLEPITLDDRQKIHRQYFTNKFVLCMYTGAFDEARREMQRCRQEAQDMGPEVFESASFYFQFCCICFGCGEYEDALEYLHHWQNQPKSVEREDLQSLARMIQLILHFELDNKLLLESLLRSATRFLRKKNRFAAFEKRFLKLMNGLMQADSSESGRLLLEHMFAEMSKWRKDSAVQTLLQTFDLEAWMEGRLSNRPFAEVVRAKRKTG